jgi:hypothetical protein
VLIASVNAPSFLAQQLKVITLAPPSGGASIATIQVDDRSILADFESNSESFLITDDAVFIINRKDKNYRVQTYAELKEGARKAIELAQSQGSKETGVELKLTAQVAKIAGFQARKLVRMNKGQPDGELWVSSDLMPARLRTLGQDLRTSLPKDYWSRMRVNPGMMEIIMMFGVPLKIVSNDLKTYQATIVSRPNTRSVFEVPAGYTKLDSSTGKQ